MITREKKTIQTYNKIGYKHAERNSDPRFWKKEFEEFQPLLKGRKIIDIGCGGGRDAKLFLRHHFEYTGIDGSRTMIKAAKKNVPKGKFLLMNFYDLRFPAHTFDGFWAAASLLHAPKYRIAKLLRSIRATIKPGGVGFISLKKKTTLDQGIIHEEKYGGVDRFFAFYTKKEFQNILYKNGFRLISSHEKKYENGTLLCFFVKKND